MKEGGAMLSALLSWRRTLTLVMALAAVCGLMLVRAQQASAICSEPPEAGTWRNVDPNTTGITSITLQFSCQDNILRPIGGSPSVDHSWYVQVSGRCYPTDCDWGQVGADRISSGQILAYYDQGFARRYVYAKMSQYRPGELWVYWHTDFVDSNRPGYSVQEWFSRAS
jgi:hypothetical protein